MVIRWWEKSGGERDTPHIKCHASKIGRGANAASLFALILHSFYDILLCVRPWYQRTEEAVGFFATSLGTHQEAGAEKKETSRRFFRGVRAGKVFLLNGTRKVWKLSHFANLEKLRLFINFVTFQVSNYLFSCKVPTKTPATDKIIVPKKYFPFRKIIHS